MKKTAAVLLVLGITMLAGSITTFAQPNDVSYQIRATLDPDSKSVLGSETITFTNNTGQSLNEIYLYLHPNRFKPGSVTALHEDFEDFDMFFPSGPNWGSLNVSDLSLNGIPHNFTVDDIQMKIELASPLANNESITLEMDFELKVPHSYRRLGYKGTNFYLSWWYPQLAVHDGSKWHNEKIVGYGSAETFQDFGSYDVELLVPQDFVVGATGSLHSEGELDGLKLLRYTAENVHDFAWVADSNYHKDTLECDGISIFSLYSPKHESVAKYMAQTACDALDYFGERFGPYPYAQFTIAESGLFGGAMEYPQLIMNGEFFYRAPKFTRLSDMVTAHEVAHQWFYGLLMSNQVAETWLDEGFAEFSTIAYIEDRYGTDENIFNKELIAEKYSDFLVDPFVGALGSLFGAESVRDMAYEPYLSLVERGTEAPVLTHKNDIPLGKSTLPYQKGAWTLLALEEYLGQEVFDEIMQTYFDRYKFNHPTSEDFIAVAEEVSGEGLDWFFDAWLRGTEHINYAVTGIARSEGRAVINLRNNGQIRMPVDVEIELKGEEDSVIERWDNISESGEVVYEGDGEVKNVLIDPDFSYPDINRLNNKIRSPISFAPYVNHGAFQGYPDDGFLFGASLAAVGQDLTVTGFYIMDRKKIGWDVSGRQTFSFAGRNTSSFSAHARDDSHILSATAKLSLNGFYPISFLLRSTHTLGITSFFDNRYDVDEDLGKSMGLNFNYELLLRDQRARFITLILDHTRNLPDSDFVYEKYSADIRINQRVAWMTYLNLRAFAGEKTGAEPVDGDFNLQDHGMFRTFERQADSLRVANVDLRFPLPGLNYIDVGFIPFPFSMAGILFADAALFPAENEDMRAAAGIGITIGVFGDRDILRFEYPLWVNTEEDKGVKELKFRASVDF